MAVHCLEMMKCHTWHLIIPTLTYVLILQYSYFLSNSLCQSTLTILAIVIIVGPNQGNVRLVQVEDFQDGVQSGAVEAYYNSEWRRVCDPKLSAAAVATTVCRQLGYNRFVNNTVL